MQSFLSCLIIVFLRQFSASVIEQDFVEANRLYEAFKKEFNKTYTDMVEDSRRFEIFKENLVRAKRFQEEELGTAKYGVTKFFDLTPEEFLMKYLTARFPKNAHSPSQIRVGKVGQLPSRFDWRDYGAVGPVLDQGRCGACWAFSTVQNIEGQWFLRYGQLLSLSVQELIDCDTYWDHGCRGGFPPYAYVAVHRLGGLELAVDYPYVERQQRCRFDPNRVVAYINGSVILPKNEQRIVEYLYQHGPLSVAINASPLQYYTSGIFKPRRCNREALNHAVLSVGFGINDSTAYWTMKNTWGTNWGEQGYFKIFRGDDTCGIAQLVTSAIVS